MADAVGEHFNRLDEADVLDLLDERVDVAAFAAAEAVEVAMVGPDVKRRRLLVVEGAQAFQRIRAGAPQLDVVTDDLFDADPFADGGDIAIGDPAGHRHSLERGHDRDPAVRLAGADDAACDAVHRHARHAAVFGAVQHQSGLVTCQQIVSGERIGGGHQVTGAV